VYLQDFRIVRGAFERNSKLAAALERGLGSFWIWEKGGMERRAKEYKKKEREFIESTQRGRIGADDEEKREETWEKNGREMFVTEIYSCGTRRIGSEPFFFFFFIIFSWVFSSWDKRNLTRHRRKPFHCVHCSLKFASEHPLPLTLVRFETKSIRAHVVRAFTLCCSPVGAGSAQFTIDHRFEKVYLHFIWHSPVVYGWWISEWKEFLFIYTSRGL